MSRLSLLPLLASLLVFGRDAAAQPAPPSARPLVRDEGTNPLRGSELVFEQSVTTQTAHLDTSAQQSYVPLYELWASLRPRYSFGEHWSVRGRFDLTKELTNAQQTTYYREDVFSDLWTDVVCAAKLDSLWRGTKGDVGLRALWPTSKVSQASGTYVTLGARAGVSHDFVIRGDGAPWLDSLRLEARFTYLHPFTTATTPTDYGTFAYTRQNVDEASFVSDQVQGTTLVAHEVWGTLQAELQLTPRVSIASWLVLVSQWHYPPADSASVATATGPVLVSRSGNDTQFTQNTWLLLALRYALIDEVDLGLGYYNLANALAPDGQRRGLFGSDNVWWSPDARVFVDVTANLDALFDDASGHRYSAR